MSSSITIAGLAIIIAAIEALHYRERKDLYNRLMCRSIDEYKRVSSKNEPPEKRESLHRKAIREWRERGEKVGRGD